MSNYPKLILFILCLSFLSACGGGSDKQAPSNNVGSDDQESVVTKQASINIHSDIPSETLDKIASISSPFESGLSPRSLEIEESGSLVVASDSDSNLLLAGILFGEEETIDETSTSIALVWLMLSTGSDSRLQNTEVISLIEANADFPILVQLVTQQLNNGFPPLESEEVVEKVVGISIQVSKAIEDYLKSLSTNLGNSVSAQSLPLNKELHEPYQVVSLSLVNLSIDENVVLENTIPSTFSVSQYSSDDETLIAPTVISSSNFNLDPFNLIAKLVKGEGVVDSILGTSKLKLLDDQSFGIKVNYNQTTAAIDIGLIFQDVVSFIIPVGKDYIGGCTKALTETLLPGEKLIELAALGSFDAVVNELVVGDGHFYTVIKKVKNGTINLASISLNCTQVVGKLDDNFLKTAFNSFKQIMKKINTVNAVVTGGSLAARIGSFIYFVQQDQLADVTVCLDQNKQVTNCTHEFSIEPTRSPLGAALDIRFADSTAITSGATIATEIEAFDKNQDKTLLPISFDFKDKNNIDIAATSLPARLWNLTAGNLPGSGNITIFDDATDTSSTEYFDVINPVFHGESEVTINVYEEKTFRLVHPAQRSDDADISDASYDTFHMEANQFEFSSDDDAVEIVRQISSIQLATVTVKGVSAGEATITAKNRISGQEEDLSVVVGCGEESALANLSRLTLNMKVTASEAADPLVIVESTGWPGFSCASSPYYTQFFETVGYEKTGTLTLDQENKTFSMSAASYTGVSGQFDDHVNISVSVPEYTNGSGADIEYPPGVRIEYSGIESAEFNLSYRGYSENKLEFSGRYRFNRRYDWSTSAAYGSSYEGTSGSLPCFVEYEITATAQCN